MRPIARAIEQPGADADGESRYSLFAKIPERTLRISLLDEEGRNQRMQALAMPQETTAQLLVFRLDQHRYALPLAAADRVVPAVAITPLPNAPASVRGVVDVAGQVLPAFDLRQRCGLPLRGVGVADHLLLAHCARGAVALLIDVAEGVVAVPQSAILDARAVTTPDSPIAGIVQLGELVLIHDLDQFLSYDDAQRLARALDGIRNA